MSDDRISDEAVKKATGADWKTWFQRLDEAGCKKMLHADIAKHIGTTYDTPAWWCQMVTVQYERARGLRAVNQSKTGFQGSKQRTLPMDQQAAFEAVLAMPGWSDLQDEDDAELDFGPVTVRRLDADVIRLWIHAPEGRSTLEVSFWPKRDKTAVRFTHAGLPDKASQERWMQRWGAMLETLAD